MSSVLTDDQEKQQQQQQQQLLESVMLHQHLRQQQQRQTANAAALAKRSEDNGQLNNHDDKDEDEYEGEGEDNADNKSNDDGDGDDDGFEIPQRFTKSGRKRAVPFPVKLMKVLSNKKFKHIITWMPSGKSFTILKPKAFVAEILPEHFKSAKYSSFTRKLHRWGFMRHYRGEEAGAFYHRDFQKDNLELVEKMTCHKGDPSKSAAAAAAINERSRDATSSTANCSGNSNNNINNNAIGSVSPSAVPATVANNSDSVRSSTVNMVNMSAGFPIGLAGLEHALDRTRIANTSNSSSAIGNSHDDMKRPSFIAASLSASAGLPDPRLLSGSNLHSTLSTPDPQREQRRVPATLPADIMLQLQRQQQQLRISDRPTMPHQMDAAERLNAAIELEVDRRLQERIQAAAVSQAFRQQQASLPHSNLVHHRMMQAPSPSVASLEWNNIQGQSLRNVLIQMEIAKRQGTLDPTLLAMATGNFSRLTNNNGSNSSNDDLPRTNIQGARTA